MTIEHGDRTPPAGRRRPRPRQWLATVAGERLLEVRAEGLEGRELKDAGDLAAHELLMRLLADAPARATRAVRGGAREPADTARDSRPTGSGSSTRSTAPASSPSRRATTGPCTSRCGRTGDLVAGAVAQPALGETFGTAGRPSYPTAPRERPRIAVSRTRPPAFVEALAAEIGADLVPDGLGRREGDLGGPRRQRRLRARRRPVRVGQRRARRRGPRRGSVLLARRRLARCATTRTTCRCPTSSCAGPSWPSRSWTSSGGTAPTETGYRCPSARSRPLGHRSGPAGQDGWPVGLCR